MESENENQAFEEMAIAQPTSFTLTGLEKPEWVNGMRTSSALFHLLGAKPLLGRLLLSEEDKPGKPPIAILSYRLWKRTFNSDSHIVGRSITLRGSHYTVAGVLRPEFRVNSEAMPAFSPMNN